MNSPKWKEVIHKCNNLISKLTDDSINVNKSIHNIEQNNKISANKIPIQTKGKTLDYINNLCNNNCVKGDKVVVEELPKDFCFDIFFTTSETDPFGPNQ